MRMINALLICGFLIIHQGTIVINADYISDILTNVERLNQQIRENINSEVSRANGLAAEAIKQAQAGAPGWTATSNGNSHYVNSGRDSFGRPYYVESENVVIGDRIFHTDRVYNHTTKKIDEHRYAVDLKTNERLPIDSMPH